MRAAEQLPLDMLDAFAKMKDGQAMLVPSPTGAQVIVLAGSRCAAGRRSARQAGHRAVPAQRRKRKLVEDDMKAMRAAAKIEYVGKFAEGAASAPPAGRLHRARRCPRRPPAAWPDADAISKGMGLKK